MTNKAENKNIIGFKEPFIIGDRDFNVFVMPMNPIKQLLSTPTNINELQQKLESLDPEKNINEYLETVKQMDAITQESLENRFKIVAVGAEANDLLEYAKEIGHLQVVVESIEEVSKKKYKTQ